jgi:hypothetical protein
MIAGVDPLGDKGTPYLSPELIPLIHGMQGVIGFFQRWIVKPSRFQLCFNALLDSFGIREILDVLKLPRNSRSARAIRTHSVIKL